jgi:hypothetical protein
MNTKHISKGLGWMSLAMGLAHLLAPDRLSRAAGDRGKISAARRRGLRQVLSGSGLLRGRNETKDAWPPLGARAFKGVRLLDGLRKAPRQRRLASAAGLTIAFTLINFLGRRLRNEGRTIAKPGSKGSGVVESSGIRPATGHYKPVKRR